MGYKDILTTLPPELSMQILEHLSPVVAIRLRRVSKRYYDLLTCEEICHFLSRRYNRTAALTLSTWRLHLENHVSRRLNFASGKPWALETLRSDLGAFCPGTLSVALIGSRRRPGSRSDCGLVSVRDLSSYPSRCVLPATFSPDGSEIEFVALLPSFVAVATKASHCYVWNLETHIRHQISLPPNSQIRGMHGAENLVAIALKGSVVVHHVQAQKKRSFKDTRSGARVRKGREFLLRPELDGMTIDTERRVVWMIGRALDRPLVVTDSLDLETGEFVQRDVRGFQHPVIPSKFPGGLWPSLNHYQRLPGGNGNTQDLIKRAFLKATGKRATEFFPVEYHPKSKNEKPEIHQWGPAISPSGLGCIVDRLSPPEVWMLSREPGEVAHLKPLNHYRTSGNSCAYFCDEFILLHGAETAVVRFKGIHDNYDG